MWEFANYEGLIYYTDLEGSAPTRQVKSFEGNCAHWDVPPTTQFYVQSFTHSKIRS